MRVLAVDFGTSNTVAALAVDGGAPRLLAIDGSPLVPSSVFLTDDGTLAVGRDADRQARLDPARFEPNPKRRIDDGDILLGSTPVPVVTAIAAVLRRVAGEVTRQLGGPADEVRLTHPARWGRRRRAALVAASREAGLAEEPVLIPEPVAAATHFATLSGHGLAEGRTLAVYDLGGGTFDAAVVRRRAAGSGYEVLAEAGLPDLGGLDFDQAILEHIGRTSAVAADPGAWAQLLAPADPASRRSARALATDIRDGKEALSRYPHVDIALPPPFADVHLTRSELDELIRGDLRRSVDLMSRTIADAGLGPADLAGVYLVGGSSRIPLVARLIQEGLGVTPTTLDQPETSVATGALYLPTGTSRAAAPVPPGGSAGGPGVGAWGAVAAGLGAGAVAQGGATAAGSPVAHGRPGSGPQAGGPSSGSVPAVGPGVSPAGGPQGGRGPSSGSVPAVGPQGPRTGGPGARSGPPSGATPASGGVPVQPAAARLGAPAGLGTPRPAQPGPQSGSRPAAPTTRPAPGVRPPGPQPGSPTGAPLGRPPATQPSRNGSQPAPGARPPVQRGTGPSAPAGPPRPAAGRPVVPPPAQLRPINRVAAPPPGVRPAPAYPQPFAAGPGNPSPPTGSRGLSPKALGGIAAGVVLLLAIVIGTIALSGGGDDDPTPGPTQGLPTSTRTSPVSTEFDSAFASIQVRDYVRPYYSEISSCEKQTDNAGASSAKCSFDNGYEAIFFGLPESITMDTWRGTLQSSLTQLDGADKGTWSKGAKWTKQETGGAYLYWDEESPKIGGLVIETSGTLSDLDSWWGSRWGRGS